MSGARVHCRLRVQRPSRSLLGGVHPSRKCGERTAVTETVSSTQLHGEQLRQTSQKKGAVAAVSKLLSLAFYQVGERTPVIERKL